MNRPGLLALEKWKQEDQKFRLVIEFKTSLEYISLSQKERKGQQKNSGRGNERKLWENGCIHWSSKVANLLERPE